MTSPCLLASSLRHLHFHLTIAFTVLRHRMCPLHTRTLHITSSHIESHHMRTSHTAQHGLGHTRLRAIGSHVSPDADADTVTDARLYQHAWTTHQHHGCFCASQHPYPCVCSQRARVAPYIRISSDSLHVCTSSVHAPCITCTCRNCSKQQTTHRNNSNSTSLHSMCYNQHAHSYSSSPSGSAGLIESRSHSFMSLSPVLLCTVLINLFLIRRCKQRVILLCITVCIRLCRSTCSRGCL